jgi:hypothetical protein
MTNFIRVGNWYNVNVDGTTYEVLIQKEGDHTTSCDPSSILVFDKTFKILNDSELYDKIQKIMERVDWEYDIVDE